jgi:hypothetical protein
MRNALFVWGGGDQHRIVFAIDVLRAAAVMYQHGDKWPRGKGGDGGGY